MESNRRSCDTMQLKCRETFSLPTFAFVYRINTLFSDIYRSHCSEPKTVDACEDVDSNVSVRTVIYGSCRECTIDGWIQGPPLPTNNWNLSLTISKLHQHRIFEHSDSALKTRSLVLKKRIPQSIPSTSQYYSYIVQDAWRTWSRWSHATRCFSVKGTEQTTSSQC